MRAPQSYIRPMLAAAVVFALFACVDRIDPTAPGTPNATDDVTVAVKLPVASLEVGHTVTAAASARNSAGEAVPVDSIEWSTSDTSILAVSPVGEVRARKMGSAFIFAKWRKKSGKGALSVTDTLPARVVVSPSRASAIVGGHMQLAAAVATATGRALPSHPVTWTSSDTRTVTVSTSGMITGARAGSVQVVAAADQVADTAIVDVSSASIASFSVTPQTSSVGSGKTVQLDAHAADADGNTLTGRPVGWASSDEDIASVSTSGVVTGGKTGTATITATAEGARAAATIQVTAGSAHTITVTPGSVGIVAGGTQQLTASVDDEAGNGLAANGIGWSSANPAVATVTPSGLVTGVHPGSTTITAVLGDAIGRASVVVSTGAVKTVTVTPGSLSLVSGGTRQMTVTLVDAVGNVVDADAAWSSSNNTVATVSASGLVTAKQSGSATITAAAGGATGTAALTVTAGSISSITVTPGSASLAAGETQQLAAKLTDNSGSVITGQTVTWSSSDASIVMVSSTGLATAGKAGTATITATSGGKSGSSAFSVSAGAVNAVVVSPASGTVAQGKTMQLEASFTDVAGNAVSGGTVAWTSSNASAATVSSTGLVTGVAAGSASITATAGGKSKSAAITVTAPIRTDPTLTSITISPATVALAPNATAQFRTVATWSDGSTTTPAVAYSASGGSISSGGLYTAGSTGGSFRVVATDVGKTDTSIVSITGQQSQSASCSNPQNVNTMSELTSALSQAQPGACIVVAPGTYTLGSGLTISNSGTASSPIVVEGAGSSTIIDVNQKTMSISASYLHLRRVRLTNFPTVGLWLRGATGDVLDSIEIDHTQQEALGFKDGSNHNTIMNSLIHDTGLLTAQYGEGIYVGSSGDPGRPLDFGVTDNQVLDSHIGPNVRAEGIDIKEGADRTIIRGNYIDGTGAVSSPSTTSLISVIANNVTIDQNYLKRGLPQAVAFHAPTTRTMAGNVATKNTIDLGGGGNYGFEFEAGTVNPMGAAIFCNNIMVSGTLSNRPCSP